MIGSRTPFERQNRPGDFVHNMLLFARQLKEGGLPVTTGRTLDVLRGIGLIRIEKKEEAYSLLSAHYVTRPEELPVFDAIFEEFWRLRGTHGVASSKGRVQPGGNLPIASIGEVGSPNDQPKRRFQAPAYSPQESLQKKDFASMIEHESEDVCRLIMALAQNLGIRLGRRWRSSGPTR